MYYTKIKCICIVIIGFFMIGVGSATTFGTLPPIEERYNLSESVNHIKIKRVQVREVGKDGVGIGKFGDFTPTTPNAGERRGVTNYQVTYSIDMIRNYKGKSIKRNHEIEKIKLSTGTE